MASQFAENPAYVEYERMLLQLHDLMAAGQGDSEEADALRDQMDEPYSELSEAEIDRAGCLSTDLYRMEEEVAAQQATVTQIDEERAEENRQSAGQAFSARDWLGLLSALRKKPIDLPAERLASLRAMAYAELGHFAVALRFQSLAAELNPAEPRHRLIVMDLLNKLGWAQDAVRVALSFLRQPGIEPGVLIPAAHTLFRFTQRLSREDARSIHDEIVASLEQTIGQVEPINAAGAGLLAIGYGILGFSYQALGDLPKAIRAFEFALTFDSTNEAIRTELSELRRVDESWRNADLSGIDPNTFGTAQNEAGQLLRAA